MCDCCGGHAEEPKEKKKTEEQKEKKHTHADDEKK